MAASGRFLHELHAVFDATYAVHHGEPTLKEVFHHTLTSIKEALDLLRTGSMKANELTSASMPLKNHVEAYNQMEDGKLSKVAVETQTA